MADSLTFLASSASSRGDPEPAGPRSKSNNRSLDAFHDLVSFDVDATTNRLKHTNNLTLAERAARAEQDRKTRLNNYKDKPVFSKGSFGDKFNASSTYASSMETKPANSNDDWNFHFVAPSDRKSQAVSAEDPWDIDFTSFESSKKPPRASDPKHTNLLDSDDISPLVDVEGSSHPPSIVRSDTPGSFDFGESDERYDDDGNDILGDLGKPIELVRNTASNENLPQNASQQSFDTLSLPKPSSSPPPHVLGKLVEMGFSIRQAKEALAETSMDVDAAVEILLRNTVDMPSERSESQVPLPVEASRRRTPVPSPHPSRRPLQNSKDSAQALQEQADRLLFQASSIGLSMFNRANTLWKEGREKVVKAYEEQRLGVSGGQDKTQVQTQPRWMENQAPNNHPPSKLDPAQLTTTAYKSPARHRAPRPSGPIFSAPPSSEPMPSTSRMSPRPISSVSPISPSPAAIMRPNIEVSSSDLAVSNAAMIQGAEHFKLGRFAEAEASYSRAIAALPELHLLRVSLYNYRAETRIKIGEYKSSIEDSTMVIRIVIGGLGNSWHPSRELGDGVALAQAVSKAYRRRAEASEGLEKWEDARADWETLNSLSWVDSPNKKDAVNGITRCKRMLSGGITESSRKMDTSIPFATMTKPIKHRPLASTSTAVATGSALSRVRAANLAQEKEDQERHELKDIVDGRLEAWRSGKEKNIRALIASLDTILPPKFNWQNVGMSELVTNNQVKARYMKAIARLHPDKLSSNGVSVEERMIANGVFGTLNEAWNSFK